MTDAQQKHAAKQFAEYWKGKGYEKGESQPFWLSLLRDVYGVEHPESYITFEDQVFLGHTSFIDGYITKTKVLIEQKAIDKDLKTAIRQSDGTLLTPFKQAKRYITELPLSKHPRFVITCNFKSFLVYDMENPSGDPEEILLENLETDYYRLSFLVDSENIHLKREMEISIQAGDIVGLIYDALLERYNDPTNEDSLKSLNMLCVRLVFCLYAEDAGIFGRRNMFHDYMARFEARDMRRALIDLFQVFDQQENARDHYIDESLAAFPYVNGGLFSDENIEIPTFTDEIRELLLVKASSDFDWSEISPTIFGAVFESTLNPETRRSGGMHYTSIENIHKVIDPLFLDDLRKELDDIKAIGVERTRNNRLLDYQHKLASLKFLDPACGSGNFLTETYISLRRLENEAISTRLHGQISFGTNEINPIEVSIGQFYGIEINDFATTVAKTALWIAESQMMKETEDVVHMQLDFLPLKSYANIIEANALRKDWNEVISNKTLDYMMGNPPFRGMKYQDASQKADMAYVFSGFENYGSLDYVASWYKKAAEYIDGTKIKVAFVSTNSITQGEQVAILWKPLFEDYGISIFFAHPTFRWDSEANIKAHVHCVIVGFSQTTEKKRKIYSANGQVKEASNINGYLCDAPNLFIQNRTKPLCDVPKVVSGNKPVDGDFLKINKEDYEEFIAHEPRAVQYIKKLVGGYEFINNEDRYVLWLVGVSPDEIRSMPLVYDRVKKVREARLAMKDEGARKLAEKPTTFRDTLNPAHYIVIPIVSSENRRYIPMGFLDGNTIPTNQVQLVPDAGLYEFGILESNAHMAWMRAVCGRLKSDYRYTAKIVYNNFPWPTPSAGQKAKIETTAQAILDARALYPDSSLADLYDENTMPNELIRAHQENDKAVMQAYGFTKDSPEYKSEAACVATLMKLYQQLTQK